MSAGLSVGLTHPVIADAPTHRAGRSLTLQVLLDRKGFSPGEIDGGVGQNTRRAIEAFQVAHELDPSGRMDEATWTALGGAPADDVLLQYTITSNDLEGPFVEHVPDDMMDKSHLTALAYTSLLEALAERFHAKPALLQSLNPRATWTIGEQILVPNVHNRSVAPASYLDGTTARNEEKDAQIQHDRNDPKESAPAALRPAGPVTVIVSDEKSTLTIENAEGTVILHAPVTSGSEHDSLPLGEWKVTGIQKDPIFHYNPALFWDGNPAHAKATIAAGPNNPVGVVWIDISKEHYGLHGTPEPGRIGYAESNGCVRLTNWDAQRVAALVQPGTRVIFR